MPNADRDDESGKYTSTYPPEAFVEAVRDADGFAGTQDVADAVGCSYELAYKRLRALADEGDVESRKVANARVWFVTDDETPATGGDESADGSDTVATTSTDGKSSPAAHDAESDAADPVDVDSLTFKRDLTPARREHLRAWLRYAVDHEGKLSKSDFEAWYTDERHAETGYNAGSFWEAFAKAAMKQSDRFTKPDTRSYRYVGDT